MPMYDESNLNLPRILCLHGGGTNARIFRSQCRVLSTHLKRKFRLVFAEAPLPCQAGPDVLSVYKEWGPFKSWIPSALGCPETDSNTAISFFKSSLQSAMEEDDEKGATGPWAGLLGFSQGAKMCASLLFLQQLQRIRGLRWDPRLNFQFGILLAGRGPLVALDPSLITPDMKDIVVGINGEKIYGNGWNSNIQEGEILLRLHTPTVHVHGLRDAGLPLHRQLLESCCYKQATRLMEWEGDHRVPIKSKDVTALVQHILAVAEGTDISICSI
ncbi:serine hydrolase FSH [Talaromyces proteolyticus]|uniref:Serine hydrolase FSH n=1 Tax=Talaromyces proteolyticus TaxID=1131652 RepID=A0AAD4KHL8_9EURO|nr:serine hydrolase FSH [Talaromyces proteolyticus]KAH8691965.1 serine hydrolase FSH [Talaromyces proteolyticus]